MDARDRTPEPREARQAPQQATSGGAGVQRVAARAAISGRGMTADAARALQATAGNRAVARMAKRQVARWADESGNLQQGGNLLDGMFAAQIGTLGEHVITVRPWRGRDGRNNNFLTLGGYAKNAQVIRDPPQRYDPTEI
jgi:hypothetical protein